MNDIICTIIIYDKKALLLGHGIFGSIRNHAYRKDGESIATSPVVKIHEDAGKQIAETKNGSFYLVIFEGGHQ